MSILIRDVDMPENCHECEYVDILPHCPCNKMADDDFWNDVSLAVEGHKDCPIIEMPDDVQPVVHGRWIADGDGYHWTYNCSICGWKDGYPFNERHNFCPNCGAKMDGEDNA